MKNRSWLLNSSKATNLYNHPGYINITLTPFEESEISSSKSNSSSSSIQKRCWTRKLVLEIANKVHYLVLFFSSQSMFFFHHEAFYCYLMPCNRLVNMEWVPSESLKKTVIEVETDWQITKISWLIVPNVFLLENNILVSINFFLWIIQPQ